MSGPARFGAVIMVTVLSCVVLGTVWGFVVYLLPESTTVSQPALRAVSPPSNPVPSLPTTQDLSESAPMAAAPPVMVRETPAAASTAAPARSPSEMAPLPFGMDLKCGMEIDGLCQEGEEDRRVCLQRQAAHVSIPCRPVLRERLVRMKETMQQLRSACEGDRRRYCPDESLGEGAIVQCLESHAQEVTDPCFQMLPKRGRLLN